MLSYIQLLSETPSEVRKRSKSVTASITKAEAINRGGKKGIKFAARGKAATEKVYYDVLLELYPVKIKSKKEGIEHYESVSEHTECFVHCTCPYFLFNCKWVLWKEGSSDINLAPKCDNKPPHITNPDMTPMVCKHLFKGLPLALKALSKIAISD